MKQLIKTLSLLLTILTTTLLALPNLHAQNPEANVIWPPENGMYTGFFVVEIKNFNYLPELATNPVTQFDVGVDATGNPIIRNEGHVHGWVFKTNRWGEAIRNDAQDRPTPASYFRFYGAGGAEFVGDMNHGYYILFDPLPRGTYRAYFQLQANDHTGAKQITAPAFPGITSVDFWVWKRK